MRANGRACFHICGDTLNFTTVWERHPSHAGNCAIIGIHQVVFPAVRIIWIIPAISTAILDVANGEGEIAPRL
jgi:hypothetical protein